VKLIEFCQRMGPLLAKDASANDAAFAVVGERSAAVPIERTAVKSPVTSRRRFDAVNRVYVRLGRAVVERLGQERWRSLLDGYFRRYPMGSIEQSENGVWLASYLREGAAGRAPAWLAELADFEWWEWRTLIAPDSPQDAEPESGPLRLASTVELRVYTHDLIHWLETERPRDPVARVTTVLFWRDADLAARRSYASREELSVIQCVCEGLPLSSSGVSKAELDALMERLRRARVLLGRP
jgi:hypothetical protein